MMSLLPNEIIAMQPLQFYSRSNVQGCCCGENCIGRYLEIVTEIVRCRNRSQKMIDDFE